ncbi:MAG: hypothetical protein AAGM67_06475, partial [Bacteroidota bacterium]
MQTASSLFARIITLACCLCFGSNMLFGQSLTEQFQQLQQGKELRAQSHLSARLHQILAHYQHDHELPITALVTEAEMALQFNYELFLYPNSNKVNIRIQAEQEDPLLVELERIGFRLKASSMEHRMIEGLLPVTDILALETLADYGLISATAFANPINNTGSVGSQADTSMQAYRVRGTAPDNFDGTGISVGVLSDSYNALSGEAAGIA